MKPLFLAVLITFFNGLQILFAQQDPDKASFKKLSIQANSSFTGNLNTSIDLLTVPGRAGLDFPIRINYSHDINYGKHASWVGLNWSLQLGSITRTVNMVPDDQSSACFGTNGTKGYKLSENPNFMIQHNGSLLRGFWDEYDTYLLNLNEGTEELIPLTDPNGLTLFQTQQFKGWDIQYGGHSGNMMDQNVIVDHLSRWKLKNSEGTLYNFGNPNYVHLDDICYNGNNPNNPLGLFSNNGKFGYPYSWDLNDIRSADYIDSNGDLTLDDNDTGGWIKFNYNRKTVNIETVNGSKDYLPNEYASLSLGVQYIEGGNPKVINATFSDWDFGNVENYFTSLSTELSKIEAIETPTHIAKFFISSRTDFKYNSNNPEQKLDSITLYKKGVNGVLSRVRMIRFVYDYSLHSYVAGNVRSYLDLKEIRFYGCTDQDIEPPYTFSRNDYAFSITYPEGGKKNYVLEDDTFQWYTSGFNDKSMADLGIENANTNPFDFTQYYFTTPKLPWNQNVAQGSKYGGIDYSLRIKEETIEDGIKSAYTITYSYGEGVVSQPKPTNLINLYNNPANRWWQGNIGYRNVTATYPDGLQILTKFTSGVPLEYSKNDNSASNYAVIHNDERESFPNYYQTLFTNPVESHDGNFGVKIESYEGLHGKPYEVQYIKDGKLFKKEENWISNEVNKINFDLNSGGELPADLFGSVPAAFASRTNRYFYDENVRMVSDGSFFADYKDGELNVWSFTGFQNQLNKNVFIKQVYKSYWNSTTSTTTTIDSVVSKTLYEYNPINNLPKKITEYRKTVGSPTDADIKITKIAYAFESNPELFYKNIISWPQKTEVGTEITEQDYFKWDPEHFVTPFYTSDYKKGELTLDGLQKPNSNEKEKWVQFNDKDFDFYYSFDVSIDDANSGGGFGFWFRSQVYGYQDKNEGTTRFYYPPNFTNVEDIWKGYYLYFNTTSNTTEKQTGLYSYDRGYDNYDFEPLPFQHKDIITTDSSLSTYGNKVFIQYAQPNGDSRFGPDFYFQKGKRYQVEVYGYWTYCNGTGIEVRINNVPFFSLKPDPLSSIDLMEHGGGTGLSVYKTKARINVNEQPTYIDTEFYPLSISENIYSKAQNKTWLKTGSLSWLAENPKDLWNGYNDPDNETTNYSYDNYNRLTAVEKVGRSTVNSKYTGRFEKPSTISESKKNALFEVKETQITNIPADLPVFQDNFSIDNVTNHLNYNFAGQVSIIGQKLELDGRSVVSKILSSSVISGIEDGFNISYDLTISGGQGLCGLILTPDLDFLTNNVVSQNGDPLLTPNWETIFISFKSNGNTAQLTGIYCGDPAVFAGEPFWYLIEEGNEEFLAQNPNPLSLAVGQPYKVNINFRKNNQTQKTYLTVSISDNSGSTALLDPIIKEVSTYSYSPEIPLFLLNSEGSPISVGKNTFFGMFSKGLISTIDNLSIYSKSSPTLASFQKSEVIKTWQKSDGAISDLFDKPKEGWSSNSNFIIDPTGTGILKLGITASNQIMTSLSQIPDEDFFVDCILKNQSDIGVVFNGNSNTPSNYQMIQLKAPNLNFVQKLNGVTTTTVLSSSLQTGVNRKILVLVSRTKNKYFVWLDGQLAGSGSLNLLSGGYVGVWMNNDIISSFDHFKAFLYDEKVVNIGYENIFDQVASISNTYDKTKIFTYDGLGRLTSKTSRYYNYGQAISEFPDMAFTYDWGRVSPAFTYPMTKPNSIKTIDYTANPATPSEAIGFFDGLGRNIQNKVKITGSSTGTLITGSIFDQNGSEAGSSIPIWSTSTSLTYCPTFWTTTSTLPLAGAALSSGMVYDYALSLGFSAAEASKAYQYAETDAIGRVTNSFLPGHVNGKIKNYYASNKDHSMPLSLLSQFGAGVPSLSRTETRDALGNGSFTFTDNFGKTIATVSKVGTEDSWTLYKYNLLNQLLEVKHPDLSHTYYTYDTHGNVVKKETPYFDKPFEYRYDQYNRVRFSRDANDFNTGIFHYFKYNKAGQVIETGTVIENATNDFETLEDSTFGDPAMDFPLTGKTADYQYFYGPELAYSNATYTLGRLAKEISLVNKETGATSIRYYSYNADGQIIWTVDEFPGILPKKITYTNDRKGNLKTLSYEDGKKDAFTQFFDYNSAGQMEVSYAGQFTDFAANYRRKTGVYYYFADGRGKQTQFAAANGTSILQSVDYSFGIEGWMKKINDLTSTTDLYAMDYSYLQNGQISAINQKIDGTFTASVNQSLAEETTFGESYTYDNASRLTAATSTGSIASKYNSTYNYDLMGNITKLTRKNNNTDMDKMSYLYGSRNRLIGITDQVASTAFTTDYDAALTTGTSLDQEVFSDNFNTGSYTQSGWSVSTANAHSFLNETGLLKIKPATMTGLNTSVFASLKSPVVTTPGGMRYLLTGLVYTSGYNAQVRLEWQKIVNNVVTVIRSDIKTVINPANGAQSLVVTAPEDAQQVVIYLELKSSALTDYATFDDIKFVEVVGFKYDANGNVISDRYRGLTTIEYNGFNLPSKLVNSASQTVNYGYAGTGSRILKKVNSTSNWYLRTVTGEILAEIEETGSVEKLKYVKLFGNKGVIGEYTPSYTGNYNYHFNLEDHLGNNKVTFTDKALASDGFEAQTVGTGLPTGLWSNTDGPTSPVSRVATVTDTQGGKSLALTTAANNYPYEYVQIESITKGVTAGTSYFLKAWGKAGSSSAGVFIGLGWYNSSNVLLSESWLFNNEKQTIWKQKGASFVAPTGATKVKILLKNASSVASTAYFDEIWLGESSDRVLVEQTQDFYPYGSTMRQYSSSVSTENVSKFKYQGKERDIESGYDYFGGRLFDPQIGRSMQVDPMAEKYIANSPFTSMGNNPILTIDPDGKDIIVLNNPKGAYINGQHYGHMAALVGSDKEGWKFISKQGRNDKAPGLNNQIVGGPSEVLERSYNTLAEFEKDQKDNKDGMEAYTESTRYSTSSSEDSEAFGAMKESAQSWYHGLLNNCADAVSAGFEKIGLDPGVTKDESNNPNSIGKPLEAKNPRPNVRYAEMKKNNKNRIKKKQDESKKYNPTQDENDIDKER